MKTLALSLALGAAVLCGGSIANAAPAQKQAQAPIASHSDGARQATDMSSRRHWRRHAWHRWHRHHRWGYYGGPSYGYYPSYSRSYGYYREPYVYRPAPVVSFGFGFGGPRWGGGGWGHHHHW